MPNSDDDRKQAEDHVDIEMKFLRARIDILNSAGLEMEDFLFLEEMVIDIEAVPLYQLYKLALYNHDNFEMDDPTQVKAFVHGTIMGYALGLKSIYPIFDKDK